MVYKYKNKFNATIFNQNRVFKKTFSFQINKKIKMNILKKTF